MMIFSSFFEMKNRSQKCRKNHKIEHNLKKVKVKKVSKSFKSYKSLNGAIVPTLLGTVSPSPKSQNMLIVVLHYQK